MFWSNKLEAWLLAYLAKASGKQSRHLGKVIWIEYWFHCNFSLIESKSPFAPPCIHQEGLKNILQGMMIASINEKSK